jgi:hypothetical protein
MRLQKEHRIELPVSRFFELMFDADFMRKINTEAMKVQSYECLEKNLDGPTWTMKNRITPQDNMPGFLKKLIGGSFSYEENVTHQKGSDTAQGVMKPNVLSDKVKMSYKVTVRPDGDNACRRSYEWEVEVKIFGVGGQIEKFAGGEIERGMDASAQFLNQYAKSKA